MHTVDRNKIREILHEYKLECYRYQHGSGDTDLVALEAKRFADEILATTFHFEFHKPINAEGAEVLGMIENYVREAVLPPVIGALAQRFVVLEKRHAAGIRCLEQILDLVEEGETATAD